MEQLKEELRHVIVKPCRQIGRAEEPLAERIAQAGRTGLMGAARFQKPRAARPRQAFGGN